MTTCRCGFDGTGEHKCHRCGVARGDAVLREQETPYSIAGMQAKKVCVETFACAPCRKAYRDAGGFITEPPRAAGDGR